MESRLTLFGGGGEAVASVALDVPENPPPALLARWWRDTIQGRPCRYAVARAGRQVRALYLAEDLIPKLAVRVPLSNGVRLRGGWATGAVRLGDWGGGRAFWGPNLFLRQVDIGAGEAWLAPLLMGFGGGAEPRRIPIADPSGEQVFELLVPEGRVYCCVRSGHVRLFGAGNTPQAVIDAVLAAQTISKVDDFLWELGAIPLQGRS